MSAHPISRKYSRALYELASEQGRTAQLLTEMQALAQAMGTDLEPLLLSPKVPLAQRLSVLDEIFAGCSDIFHAFLHIVVGKGRAALLSEMAEEFRVMHDRSLGRVTGLLESAIALDDTLVGEIRSQISQKLGFVVELESKVRPELLGGFRVRAEGRLLDATLKSRLEALRKHMKAAPLAS